jgi:hypothetical protein
VQILIHIKSKKEVILTDGRTEFPKIIKSYNDVLMVKIHESYYEVIQWNNDKNKEVAVLRAPISNTNVIIEE